MSALITRRHVYAEISRLARRIGGRATDLLLPPCCIACEAPSDATLVCAGCRDDLPRVGESCPQCALPSPGGERCGACLRTPPAFDASSCVLRYQHPVDRMVLALKFAGALPVAQAFAALLADRIGPRPDIELIVPMPLGHARLRERGFNQAHEIARRVASLLEIPIAATATERVRDTVPQSDLSIDHRVSNVRNAFSADAAVVGRRIAVVDDVMTTGATLGELARTLKRAGALHVENWVVARAFRD